jgi:hypothetical protein
MPSFAQLRDLDSRAWSTATWTIPFITQLDLAAVIVIAWLLGKRIHEGFALFLISVTVTTLMSVVAVGFLLRSPSPRAHGVAISIIGTSLIVAAGGLLYGTWILRW